MHDLNAPLHAAPAAGAAMPARPRRRWLRVVLAVFAAIGLLAVALLALGYYLQTRDARTPKRVVTDEAAVIDTVMGETYGKYSEAKQGWLYTGADNVTYLMRVVHQARIPDGVDGDELYFVASGASVSGSEDAMYGVFWLRPNRPYDGTLRQSSMQTRYWSKLAVRADQVRFEALSETLWGWVVKRQLSSDPAEGPVTTMNTVIAPHDDRIAELGEFLAAREANPAQSCDEAKAAWDAWQRGVAAGRSAANNADEPPRCDKRRWTYRTGTVDGTLPVPITVTVGGMLDGQSVEPRSWKLMFDPKSFKYAIPDDLKLPRSEAGEE